jgi:FkbM family methyltransferase
MYTELFREHIYEVKSLPAAPRIIDCGGNIGMSVIWFKQRYPQARITVFEADPTLADILADNVHHLGLTSVEVVKAAVSGTSSRVGFARQRAMTGHLSAEGELYTDCVRLSERLDEPVDLLKVDIEGSEFSLLSDLCASGKIKLVKHLICEIHGSTQLQVHFGDLWTELCRAGFQVTVSGGFTHPGLPGEPDPTPFASVESGKYLLWLYAWRP